jgi:hypothetical protein
MVVPLKFALTDVALPAAWTMTVAAALLVVVPAASLTRTQC